jgi:predicted metal-dependent phosphoesterase TrpH
MLELHCHTTYSDGTLTPTALVAAAVQAGVKGLAITDHDTLSGWPEAFAAAANTELEIIPGVELSTVHLGRSLHILGFYPDPDRLLAPLAERQAGRQRRALAMVAKLADLGYAIEVPQLEEGITPGRPHIATALMRAGHVKTIQEAFDRFLGDNKPAYVNYEKFSAQEGIALLRTCGAVPVWAHPYLFRGSTVPTVLPELVDAGLMGLEVYHPHHSPSQTRKLKEFCQQYNLLMTGGSDYHGPPPITNAPITNEPVSNPKPRRNREQISPLNGLKVPWELLAPLKQTANQLNFPNNPSS